jgi:hypothetical protein
VEQQEGMEERYLRKIILFRAQNWLVGIVEMHENVSKRDRCPLENLEK